MKFCSEFDLLGLEASEVQRTAQSLNEVFEVLRGARQSQTYSSPETFLNLPFDTALHEEVAKLSKSLPPESFKYILVMGMGGSSLGSRAVYEALRGRLDFLTDSFPKLLFVDTLDTKFLSDLNEGLPSKVSSFSEVLVMVISKSGRTLETLCSYSQLGEFFRSKGSEVLVVTQEGSPLWEKAESGGIHRFPVPVQISGRFSFFSGVGLLPLYFAGFDLKELCRGADEVILEVLEGGEFTRSGPVLLAVEQYLLYQRGLRVHPFFYFGGFFESLGKWSRQLAAESLGKKGLGVTPVVALGPEDLHSLLQLYLGGPRDKFTVFVTNQAAVGGGAPSAEVLYGLEAATKEIFRNRGLPYAEIELEDLVEKELGRYLQFEMLKVVFLANLLDVDPFTQPEIEKFKNLVRNITPC